MSIACNVSIKVWNAGSKIFAVLLNLYKCTRTRAREEKGTTEVSGLR